MKDSDGEDIKYVKEYLNQMIGHSTRAEQLGSYLGTNKEAVALKFKPQLQYKKYQEYRKNIKDLEAQGYKLIIKKGQVIGVEDSNAQMSFSLQGFKNYYDIQDKQKIKYQDLPPNYLQGTNQKSLYSNNTFDNYGNIKLSNSTNLGLENRNYSSNYNNLWNSKDFQEVQKERIKVYNEFFGNNSVIDMDNQGNIQWNKSKVTKAFEEAFKSAFMGYDSPYIENEKERAGRLALTLVTRGKGIGVPIGITGLRAEGYLDWVSKLSNNLKAIKYNSNLNGNISKENLEHIKETGKLPDTVREKLRNLTGNEKTAYYASLATDVPFEWAEYGVNHPYEFYLLGKVFGIAGTTFPAIFGKTVTKLGFNPLTVETVTKGIVKKTLRYGLPYLEFQNALEEGYNFQEAMAKAVGAYGTVVSTEKGFKEISKWKESKNTNKILKEKGTIDEFYNKLKKDPHYSSMKPEQKALLDKWYEQNKGMTVINSFENYMKLSEMNKRYNPKTEKIFLDHIIKNPEEKKIVIGLLKKHRLYVTGSSASGKVSANDLDLVARKPRWAEFPTKFGNIKTPLYDFGVSKPEVQGKRFFEDIAKEGIEVAGIKEPKDWMNTEKRDMWKIEDKFELSKNGEKIWDDNKFSELNLAIRGYVTSLRRKFGFNRKYSETVRSPKEYLQNQKYGDAVYDILKSNQKLTLMGKQSENMFTKKTTKTFDFDTMTSNLFAKRDATKALKLFEKKGYKNLEINELMYKDMKTGELKSAHDTWQIKEKGDKGKVIMEITPRRHNMILESINKEGINLIPKEEAIRAKAYAINTEWQWKRWIKDAKSIERLTEGKIKAKDILKWKGEPEIQIGQGEKVGLDKPSDYFNQEKIRQDYVKRLTTERKAKSYVNNKKVEIHTQEWMQSFPHYKGQVYDPSTKLYRIKRQEQFIRKIYGGYVDTRGTKDIPDLMALNGAKIKVKELYAKEFVKGRTPEVAKAIFNAEKELSNKFDKVKENVKKAEDKIIEFMKEKKVDKRIIEKQIEMNKEELNRINNKENYRKYLDNIRYKAILPYVNYNVKGKYSGYEGYKGYEEYSPYEGYDGYDPYEPYEPYKPYEPYEPYEPYKPYEPYEPYLPYKPYNIYASYSPKKIEEKEPPILFKRKRDKKITGHQVQYYKEDGKKILGKIYPNRIEATGRGFNVVDKTPLNKFMIKKVLTQQSLLSRYKGKKVGYKFKNRDNVYIEKIPYRFDTKGEKGGSFNIAKYVFNK